ncbi:MAG: orotate phosphoribosyltransferase [Bacteroidia bacterium]
MKIYEESALKVAEFLLQIKAIQLQPQKPFTWASGWKSPIYCDNRKSLSYPKIRTYIRQQLAKAIQEEYGKPDVIAGVATGGIAQGALVAQELNLPFVYVRPEPKKHGLGNQVEGVIEKGQSVVLIEDLISTGKSSINAVEAIRDAGCEVKGMVAIFTYGFEIADENFKKNKCDVIALSDYDTLINQALKTKYITKNDIDTLKAWKQSPDTWNQ